MTVQYKKMSMVASTTIAILSIVLSLCKAQALTLDEALVSTYKSNPELKAIISTLQADMETYPQALAGFLPTVDLNYQTGYVPRGTLTPSGGSSQALSSNVYSDISLDIRMNLFKSFGDVYAVKGSKRAIRSLTYNFYANEQQVLYKSIIIYMDLITAEKTYELKRATEKSLDTNLNITQVRSRSGEASTGDRLEAEASYTSAVADRIDAEAKLTRARNDFFRQIGLVGQELEIPTVNIDELPKDKEAYVYQSLYNNALLLSAFYNHANARYQVHVMRANLLPKIDAVANMSHSNQNGRDSTLIGGESYKKNTGLVGLHLQVPLYDAGYYRSLLRAQKNTANAANFTYQNTRNMVLADAETAWDNLITAKAYMEATEQGVKSAESAVESTRSEYKAGTKGIIDLLTSEQNLLNAQLNQVNGMYQYTIAIYNAKQVMGVLTPENLKLAVMPYSPDKYFKNIRNRFIRTSIPQQEMTDDDDDEMEIIEPKNEMAENGGME